MFGLSLEENTLTHHIGFKQKLTKYTSFHIFNIKRRAAVSKSVYINEYYILLFMYIMYKFN